ncbi:aminotransferase class III-fold pyridoxal phosphate-dependent enzyme [Motilimonas sp. 1_MG-2023]|uniref:aminotransferase class III-fold pyridoxal phosphate-dependent enzyme n=1 Tax=Motilimonas TaxID=1914248 RepID=UPI0026E26F6C|nr:aminotransferase class III-fold pyridoxal phosphate-dependent enzyme [Motilimonas sp. 1_MG-2023]MDO6524967.1 aminotransferase class III-fold pyridoxal phosphate-dependent enzyme [Motilimonas sp. 1_MG-2023]
MSQIDPRYQTSSDFYQQAKTLIPLASQTFSKSRLSLPYGVAPLFLERGEGCQVWDIDNNQYTDFINGLLCVSLGYQDPDVDRAVIAQISKGVSFSLPHRLEFEVAQLLVDLIPCAEMVRFGKNGSDVTAAAIRLARAFTNKEHIAVCGYHGWQDWYIGATSRNLGVPKSTQALTHPFPFNDLSALNTLLSQHEFAAVIMEPMNVVEPEPGYLAGVKALCEQHQCLLIFDEIITGFRFDLKGAQHLFGVTPDLATFGKGMANGYPLSAIVGKKEIMMLMEDIFFSGTFGGEALSLAAAKASIEKMIRCQVPEHINQLGTSLQQGLASLLAKSELFKLVGHPSWSILSLSHDSEQLIKSVFLQEMYQRGMLTLGTHNISYAHQQHDITRLISAYQEIVPFIEHHWQQGTLRTILKGAVIEPVFKVR